MNRRQFTKTTISATAALAFYRTTALAMSNYKNIPLGFQSWPVKDRLGKDFPGTLKIMSGMGYKLIELCSPAGYKDIGFGFLTGMSNADIRKTIEDAGLHCPSCHFGFAELTDHIDQSIDFAKAMGLTQMICSTFGLPRTAQLSDYQTAADKLNIAAEKIKKAGIATGYHNHDMEFSKIDGQLIYDTLMARFDAKLVKMQFQTEVINLGYKAADYFEKYPGRFISSHLSDWTADKKEVPIGQGVIDWGQFFKAAKTGGVKNFFVEMKFETLADSEKYIAGL
ncbi:MAG TPA: TIM barrel protein [Puia sp.]|jgi:sugar phosphate isomerase/epimerase|nr:TIM barrel protein [Puia sp.]